ncbi:MAG TPA: hypothetical protein VKM55_04825, partial [Candidatus Lokiarchaeia archaeon]|nr:hypothetical protein [Candidatus Lokiarchaeia archaeon]
MSRFTSPGQVQASSSAPTTTISYTPTYTSGSKNWVTTSTGFTLSANSYATGYAEDFEWWPIGATITGPSPAGGGSWTKSSGDTATIVAGRHGQFQFTTTNNEWGCFTTADHTIVANDYYQFDVKFSSTTPIVYLFPGYNVINSTHTSNICYVVDDGSTGPWYVHDSGGWHGPYGSITANTWYQLRYTFTSQTQFTFSVNGTQEGGTYYTTGSWTDLNTCLWEGGTAATNTVTIDNINPSWLTVTNTYYKWSGSGTHAWTHYTTPFTLAGMGNGTYTISYCSYNDAGTDSAPANETLHTTTVLIDATAPTTTCTFTASYTSGSKNWVTSTTTFTLTGTDNTGGSGVSTTKFKVWFNTTSTELKTWQTYSGAFTLGGSSNGTYIIIYSSVDNCGNNETLKALTVYVDTIAPTTGISYMPALPPNIVNITTIFTLTPSDNTGGSGIATTQYQYDGSGGYHVYTAPFTLSLASNGSITINYYSIDHAGNVETAGATVVLMISNPVATSTPATAAMITPNSTF